MKLRISDRVDPEEWDALVCAAAGPIFHSSGWAAYTAAAVPHAIPRFFTLDDASGQVSAVALGFEEHSPHRLTAPLSGRLSLEALPAVLNGGEGVGGQFLNLLEDYARRSGQVELTIGSFASAGGAEVLGRLGFELRRRLEFELSLEVSEEGLWEGMEYKRRKNIKKAVRLGVDIRDLPADEGTSELRRLQHESGQRILGRGGPDVTHHSRSACDPIVLLVASGLGRIVGARLGGKYVSASLFTCFNGLVYHTLSGHDATALESQAPTLVVWETIKQYRAEGAKRFNFGGCSSDSADPSSPEHGVYVYKKGFGADTIATASGCKVLRPQTYRLAHFLKRALRR